MLRVECLVQFDDRLGVVDTAELGRRGIEGPQEKLSVGHLIVDQKDEGGFLPGRQVLHRLDGLDLLLELGLPVGREPPHEHDSGDDHDDRNGDQESSFHVPLPFSWPRALRQGSSPSRTSSVDSTARILPRVSN